MLSPLSRPFQHNVDTEGVDKPTRRKTHVVDTERKLQSGTVINIGQHIHKEDLVLNNSQRLIYHNFFFFFFFFIIQRVEARAIP